MYIGKYPYEFFFEIGNMNIWSPLIIIILAVAYFGNCQSDQTIVPKQDQITDFETQLTIARILSHHQETQEAGLKLYELFLKKEQFPYSFDHPRIKSDFNSLENLQEKPKTIVPQNNWINRFEATWALARIFSRQEKTQEIALNLYENLLQKEPENIEVIIETGRLYIILKQFQEGLDLFYHALETHPHNIKLLVATAQAEVNLGHAQKARNLFLLALDLSTEQDALSVDFADGMMMWGDFYKAEIIYRDALENKPCSLDLFLKLAWSLASQQRYEEAEGIYKQLLLVYPNGLKILEPLTRLKIEEKDFDKAQETVDILLKIEPTTPKYLQLKAEILFQKQLYDDSIAIYNEFKNDRKYALIAWVGIGRAYQKLGLDGEAQAAFQAAYTIDPKNIEARYYVAGQYVDDENFIENFFCNYEEFNLESLNALAIVYIQNGKPEIALIIYTKILELDPNYFPAQIGQAEVFSTLFSYNCALEIYQNLIQSFPEDYKIMLATARVLASSKKYQEAIDYYEEIIFINPFNPVLYREKARTALWGKKFNLAMRTYNQILQLPMDDCEVQSRIQESVLLEKRAKKLNWNKRYICALKAYKRLLAFNPGNEEALFDYAQVYCSLGLCACSKNIYENILTLDPNHGLVKKALYRNEIRNHIGLQSNFSYWREVGSGTFSASQIARYRLDEVVEIPLSCSSHLRFSQQEYVENPFFNFKFYPAEGQTIEADRLFNDRLSVSVSATYKNYFHKFRSTITSHNRLLYTINDYLKVLFSYNKEDEIYNYFSLKQAIQSNISLITLSSNLTPYWNISGTYQYYHYNDHNSQFHFNLLTEYQLTEDPNVLKIILQGDYRNAAHQTVSILDGTQLINMIHPYWTPNKYCSANLTLEWRHDYRRFEFCEAPQRYVDIKLTGLVDNAHNPSVAAILEWKHEFECHWGFEIKGFIQRGPLWNAEGAWGTLSYRF